MPHYTRPAPIGGWNTISPIDQMPDEDAIVLDNWIPRDGYCETRFAMATHSGIPSAAFSLMAFESATTPKLVAATATSLYDATTSGAAATLITAGYANGYWQHTMANGLLLMCNGADVPQSYNGTVTANVTLTIGGIALPTNPINLCQYKGRMFYILENSPTVYYCTAGAFQGATTALPFTMLAVGNVINMFTWTLDAGDGMDDMAVFVFSTGDVLVYQGDDPSSATAWQLVGRFRIGRPLSYRGTARLAGTQIIMTTDGYEDITSALRDARLKENNLYSAKINLAVRDAVQARPTDKRWTCLFWPEEGLFIANAPQSASVLNQHARNTNTGAWCRLTGMNLNTLCVFNGELYGTHSTSFDAYKMVFTASAFELNIDCYAEPGYTRCGIPGQRKQLTAVQHVTDYPEPSKMVVRGQADSLAPVTPDTPASGTNLVAAYSAEWAQCVAYGESVSACLRIKPYSPGIKWYSTGYLMRVGGPL